MLRRTIAASLFAAAPLFVLGAPVAAQDDAGDKVNMVIV